MRVTLGVPGRMIPPAAKAIELAQRAECDGFDAVWWPDHLMGWIPDAAWTEDMTPLVLTQPNPHAHFDPLMMIGAAGVSTERVRLGVCVLDAIRRHPAMLAQAALTADHLTRGRLILGLGAGELMNVAPYGIEWHKPVGRLEETLAVMRLLWQADEPVSFEGEFFRLEDAVLGLRPFEGRIPSVWLAAHGPRMLRITGAVADGWLPTNIGPKQYAEKLSAVRASATAAGRDPDEIVPSMLAYVVCAPDEAALERVCSAPVVRLLYAAVDLPPEVWERHGSSAPFEGGAHQTLIPSAVSRADVERMIGQVPPSLVREHSLCGTAEAIAEQLLAYHRIGLRDVVLWNLTPFGDSALSEYSFYAMRELRQALSAPAQAA